MKDKHLTSILQSFHSFEHPKIELEQYGTPPEIAVAIIKNITRIVPNLDDCLVADLGCGVGILTGGIALIGACFTIGFDIDEDALAICNTNIMNSEILQSTALIQTDVTRNLIAVDSSFAAKFDVVVTNPPFGTKNNYGMDIHFVLAGLNLLKPGGKLFSLHKSVSRDFLHRKVKSNWANCVKKMDCLAEMRWNIDRTYKFHRHRSLDISVDLFCFEKK